jgi:putative hemolysin
LNQKDKTSVFRLAHTPDASPAVARFVQTAAERLLGLDRLDAIYRGLARTGDVDAFLAAVLDLFGVSASLAPGALERVPREGPVLVVANHPFGAIEGILLASLLRQVRPDVRILVNELLERIPELKELFISVDAFGAGDAARANAAPMRRALRWLQGGGLLLAFPSGTVAHLQLARGCVADPPWHPSIGRLVRMSRAQVVPVHVHGANSALFQLAGLLHPRLRTALLPRELLNKTGRRIHISIGRSIPGERLTGVGSDADITRYLRRCSDMLADATPSTSSEHTYSGLAAVAPAVESSLLANELARLDPSRRLLANGPLHVYCTPAEEIPWCMQEIGRLREITFRAVGEGTGKAADLDLFDRYYRHLFVWHAEARQIVGAYRLGFAGEILARYGKRGLYTHTLFRYGRPVLQHIEHGIELGRSFVRAEYQKSFSPLMLMWQGIFRLVARSPDRAVLFGPVSISNDYSPISKQLLVEFLEAHNAERSMRPHVRARRPFRSRHLGCARDLGLTRLRDLDEVSRVLAHFEPDEKGVPVLLRHYLKLGGQILGFNRDPHFGNALDALIMVDVRGTDVRLLERYMGREHAAAFLAYHAREASRTGS